jgi:glycosyltransferase involved in cell wall biosynthesis
MSVSVIIPTYNGRQKLSGLLNALEKQDCREFEVIVVIDGSEDDTYSYLQNNNFNLPSIKIINQLNQGRGKARNIGAEAATGPLLVFFDDDIIPEPNTLTLHIAHHIEYTGCVLFGAARMHLAHNPENEFFKYRFAIEDQWHESYKNKLTKITFENYAFTTANMSVPKELFIQMHGFDNRLNDSEDFDFSIRALLLNIPIYFDYSIWSWHCDYVNISGYIKRQKEYRNSKSELACLKPEYVNYLPKNFEFQKIHPLKLFFSRGFKYNRFWSLIIHGRLFLILVPKIFRYKLYNKIIFSSSII